MEQSTVFLIVLKTSALQTLKKKNLLCDTSKGDFCSQHCEILIILFNYLPSMTPKIEPETKLKLVVQGQNTGYFLSGKERVLITVRDSNIKPSRHESHANSLK